MKYDLVVMGGGPGGLAAAIEAKKNGIDNILVIERDKELGGILQQCIHNGFGLHEFKEDLTGPEYAQRFIEKLLEMKVIGGGPGGLAAAIEAKKNGIDNILVIERDKELGGILQQCIHNGFGLHEFKEELTGPEYAQRFIEKLLEMNIEYKLDTMVLDLTEDKKIHAINSKDGYMVIEAKAVILAMGCRERTRGAISIPGDRPSGVFTAGAAQRFINMEGYMVGKKVLILGSGDIGLIMARRLTLEGAEVKAVVELMPFSGGLTRNIVQCLDDYNIPLYLSHTVIDVVGKDRLEKVVIAKVDENRKPIPGTEKEYECDTLLLSVGLIPENDISRKTGLEIDRRTNGLIVNEMMETSAEGIFACCDTLLLSVGLIPENDISRKTGLEIDRRTNGLIVNEMMETSAEGIFACGNVVHVHDLVDFVSAEARKAGAAAARYIKNEVKDGEYKEIINGKGITYTVPQKFRGENIDKALEIFMRVNNIYKNVKLEVKDEEKVLMSLNKQHLAPGEMEKVMVPKKILDTMVGKSLTVEVTGGDK